MCIYVYIHTHTHCICIWFRYITYIYIYFYGPDKAVREIVDKRWGLLKCVLRVC